MALSRPQPLSSTGDPSSCWPTDEALLVFDFGDAKAYAWIITKTGADWTELKISAAELDAQVEACAAVAHSIRGSGSIPSWPIKVYQATFGAFADRDRGEETAFRSSPTEH